MQNKHSATKRSSHRPPQTLCGMGCKRAAWSITKISVSGSLQPLTDSKKHLKNFSHRLELPLPWQLIKWRMKNQFRFPISKEMLVSLCHSSIPQMARKTVKFPVPMYLESTCRNLFILTLCFNFYFCPAFAFPCEIIFMISYQVPSHILLGQMCSSPFLPLTRQDLSSLHHPTHSHMHRSCFHFSMWTQVIIGSKWDINKAY